MSLGLDYSMFEDSLDKCYSVDCRRGQENAHSSIGIRDSADGFMASSLLREFSELQGGIGPAGLATEDLHVLDFTELDKPRWHR